MEENKTIAEVTPAVEETKKSVLNASVAPENFDWDAFENDDVYGGSVEAIAEQYASYLGYETALTYAESLAKSYATQNASYLVSVFTFGGTTLLIVVGVANELYRELEAQLTMRNYKGFLN